MPTAKVDSLLESVDTLRCEVREATRSKSKAGRLEGASAMLGPDVRQRPETRRPNHTERSTPLTLNRSDSRGQVT